MEIEILTIDTGTDVSYKAAKEALLRAEARHHNALADKAEAEKAHEDELHTYNLYAAEHTVSRARAEALEAEHSEKVGRIALRHAERSDAQEARDEKNELAEIANHFIYDLHDVPYVNSLGQRGIIPAISDSLVSECIDQIGKWHRQSLPENRPDIEIILNTGGGDINAGFALIDYIRLLRERGHKVTIRVLGQAASMGAVVLQAADWRIMGKHSMMMLHKASFSAFGDYNKVVSTVKLVDIYHDSIVALLAERSTLTPTKVKNLLEKDDYWISAAEAKRLGFVDELV